MIVLMHTDLPEPVAPAISRCGIFARSATTGLTVEVPAQRDRQLAARAAGTPAPRSARAAARSAAWGSGPRRRPRLARESARRCAALCARMASARSSARVAIRSTLHPARRHLVVGHDRTDRPLATDASTRNVARVSMSLTAHRGRSAIRPTSISSADGTSGRSMGGIRRPSGTGSALAEATFERRFLGKRERGKRTSSPGSSTWLGGGLTFALRRGLSLFPLRRFPSLLASARPRGATRS